MGGDSGGTLNTKRDERIGRPGPQSSTSSRSLSREALRIGQVRFVGQQRRQRALGLSVAVGVLLIANSLALAMSGRFDKSAPASPAAQEAGRSFTPSGISPQSGQPIVGPSTRPDRTASTVVVERPKGASPLTRSVNTPPQYSRPGLQAITHQVSIYDVSKNELAKARAAGLTLLLADSRGIDKAYRSELEVAGIHYIDRGLWNVLHPLVPDSCKKKTSPCFTAQEEAPVLSKVQSYLASVKNDDLLVAFYALDDYPGNIADLLIKIHDLVAASNGAAPWARPTVCGFGADLDFRDTRGWHRSRAVIEHAAINYRPEACDVVSVYAYGPSRTSPTDVDWSMTRLMPDVERILGARGWQSSQPLIGTPMAFAYLKYGWIAPTADDLRSQTAAFCNAGATSLMPYAWDDSYSGPKLELGNDPDMQRGFAAGISDCHAVWRTK